ncbi:MAG: hypothetical protein IJE93_08150 [Clostridia bacterium]|nr:hypothetical protein [Clostridia bacterium]
MGKLRTLFHVITLGIVDSNEEYTRKNTPCVFSEVLSKKQFSELAIEVAKPIKRLKVTVADAKIFGEVKSVSGISKWFFILDYNDFGKVTGNYWVIKNTNTESSIPNVYAEDLKNRIIDTINQSKYIIKEKAKMQQQKNAEPTKKYYIVVKGEFIGELYDVSGPYSSFKEAEEDFDFQHSCWADSLEDEEYLSIVERTEKRS